MKQISVDMNKVVTKGAEMNKLEQELQEFKGKAVTSESVPNVADKGEDTLQLVLKIVYL